MYNVLLVSEQRVKMATALDENIRMQDITNFIIKAQDIYIRRLLGTSFFEKIKEGVKNNSLSVDEENILNYYIGPTLIHYSLYEMLPFTKYKITAKGLLNGASEETQPTDLTVLKYLRQLVLDIAEDYAAILLKELKDYPSRFPEYQSPGTIGIKPDKSSPYFSGLMTHGTKRCDYFEGKSKYSSQ
jgi:hypothetical protein